ncbi:MAG: hypothetical protein WCX70_01765 [Candidatus Paceibacterota bacterium]|jgi:hypothetical protein
MKTRELLFDGVSVIGLLVIAGIFFTIYFQVLNQPEVLIDSLDNRLGVRISEDGKLVEYDYQSYVSRFGEPEKFRVLVVSPYWRPNASNEEMEAERLRDKGFR